VQFTALASASGPALSTTQIELLVAGGVVVALAVGVVVARKRRRPPTEETSDPAEFGDSRAADPLPEPPAA
jgi:hypothetical protein